jgi:hypothetical protein
VGRRWYTGEPLVVDSAGSGWTNLNPTAINAQGDIAGYGMLNGVRTGFLISQGKRTAAASVACSPVPGSSSGASTDTCTVTVSDVSGVTPSVAPSGNVSVTATTGALTNASCTLVPQSVAGSSSCSVAYVPPSGLGSGSTFPVVAALYSGDGTFGSVTGRQTLDCASGAVFDLNSVDSTVTHTNGYEVDHPITLNGCGLTSTTLARFGADNATVTPDEASDVAADGTSMTVTVPDYAISGLLAIATPSGVTTTLATPKTLSIDSWRNTNGFSFENGPGALTEEGLATEFPTSNLTVPGSGGFVLRPWVQAYYNVESARMTKGVCYGMSLTSGEFADHELEPSILQSGAETGWDLKLTPSLLQFLSRQQMAQFSDQALKYRLRAFTVHRGALELMGEISDALQGDGWKHAAIIGGGGHAEAVYGVELAGGTTAGVFAETADSVVPFTDAEDADTTGKTHAAVLDQSRDTRSWAELDSTGGMYQTAEKISTPPQHVVVTPVSAVEGTLTVFKAPFYANHQSVTISPFDQVNGVTSPGGKSINDQDSSAAIAVSNDDDVSDAGSSGSAAGGVAQLLLSAPDWVSLSSNGKPLVGLWQSTQSVGVLQASSGHVRTQFEAGAHSLQVTTVKGQTAPGPATVSVTAKLDGDLSEHTVAVSGPADVSVSLKGGDEPIVTAPEGGTYTISVTGFGKGQPVQSALLGTVAIPKGGSLTVRPQSWGGLATGTAAAVVSHGGTTHRVVLHNYLKAAVARVTHLTVKGSRLRVTLRVPTLVARQGAITVTASGHGVPSRSAMLNTGGRAHTATVIVRLRRAIKKTTKLTLKVTTINGGSAPTEAASVYRSR